MRECGGERGTTRVELANHVSYSVVWTDRTTFATTFALSVRCSWLAMCTYSAVDWMDCIVDGMPLSRPMFTFVLRAGDL